MRKAFLSWLTDRIILEPSRREIAAPHKRRVLLSHGDGHIEVWVHRTLAWMHETRDPDLYVLKFPGTASRAEDSTDMVDNCWPDLSVEVWAVNPPGYGGSTGKASLCNIPSMASHVRWVSSRRHRLRGRPLVVAGGSLGCVSALYLAARHGVDGVLVQNPPALREVIQAQSGWWHFAWFRVAFARQIPEVLDSIRNAAESRVPCRVSGGPAGSRRTGRVPAADHRCLRRSKAGALIDRRQDHDTPLHEGDVRQLRALAAWLNQAMTH